MPFTDLWPFLSFSVYDGMNRMYFPSSKSITYFSLHTARKIFNSFQTLLNHIQGCVGCQMKGKTSIDMNLVVFCAKIQLELKNLQKCGKGTIIHTFFEIFHTFFKRSPILAQNTPKIIFIEVFCYFWHPSHPWTWLSSGDIAIFKIFFHIFHLQRHLGVDFSRWKIGFKLSCIDFGITMYHFLGF